jgi:hypothetical protein
MASVVKVDRRDGTRLDTDGANKATLTMCHTTCKVSDRADIVV